ncbi:MAG: wax ester/triacylglycerol synthase family O-acyltransferase [Microthrixaceae bacterium]|nr:wax ester/triacylglycerol synthase family O-acyltransferase [Microthrixaceae bacterium]
MNATEPVSPEDATLWCATAGGAQLQIGALCRFEGAPLRGPDGEVRTGDLRAHVASRLHLMPRFRQRIREVPLDLARPVWVDDADFDLDRHLCFATLPEPGDPDRLRAFVGDLIGRPLDPLHPLWDMWLIDGLDDGTDDIAVVLRTHHVVADGLSLLRAAVALLDFEEGPSAPDSIPVWSAAREPDALGLVVGGLAARYRSQLAFGINTTRRMLDPRRILDPNRALRATRSLASSLTSRPRPAPRLELTGRVGANRDFVWSSLPMEPLRELAHSREVTLNDVVLSIVCGALRRLVGPENANRMGGRPPKVLVPVGDSAADEGGGNAFSFVVTTLPVDLGDPADVLDRIHADMCERKASQQSADMLSLFSVVDLIPVPALRRLAPALLARQPFVNLAVTNLPGSPVPLYLLGSRLLSLQPIVTGVGNIACIVGVLSYCGELGIGITVDRDVVPDAERFRDGMLAAAAELLDRRP